MHVCVCVCVCLRAGGGGVRGCYRGDAPAAGCGVSGNALVAFPKDAASRYPHVTSHLIDADWILAGCALSGSMLYIQRCFLNFHESSQTLTSFFRGARWFHHGYRLFNHFVNPPHISGTVWIVNQTHAFISAQILKILRAVEQNDTGVEPATGARATETQMGTDRWVWMINK